MANGFLPTNAGIGTLPPELFAQQQALNRQQQMAQLLMQQGMQQPQGQMVSGQYVRPSIFQQIAPLAQMYAGTYLQEKGDKQALDMATALRKRYGEEMENYLKLQRGTPAVAEQTTEMAGPFGEGVGPNNTNIPMPTAYRPAQAAVPPDPVAANLYGSTAFNPVLQQFAAKKMLEGPQWKEISQYNPQTGNTENYRYDANSTNPRETMQFLGISKPALSAADIINFREEGVSIPPQFAGGVPTQPTTQNAPVVQSGGQPSVSPTSQAPTAPKLPSTQTNNPFVPPSPPAGLTNKQIREWKLDQAKPLTGTANDIVNGAVNYQKAIFKIQELFDKYSPEDLLKPNVRAIVKQAVENARLQGKEANKLGALTGPDYGILEKLVVDPTAFNAFLVDRNTINKIYNNERMFTSDIIKTTYGTAQKAVPENLRQWVEVKPKELASDNKQTQGQPRPTGRVVRAMLGNQAIVVRNGQWVDERTGNPVQ